MRNWQWRRILRICLWHYSRVDSLLALRSIQQSPPFLWVYAFRKSFRLDHNVAVWSVWEINLYLLSCPLAATKWKRIPSTIVDGRTHSHSVSWLALVVSKQEFTNRTCLKTMKTRASFDDGEMAVADNSPLMCKDVEIKGGNDASSVDSRCTTLVSCIFLDDIKMIHRNIKLE